jgi:hypothetical protein
MNWASHAIERLEKGEEVSINPRGNSMKGLIESGARVTLSPINKSLEKQDIVLVKVKGRVYLHLIHAVDKDRYLIGNNIGRINGWVGRNAIYGIATSIE